MTEQQRQPQCLNCQHPLADGQHAVQNHRGHCGVPIMREIHDDVGFFAAPSFETCTIIDRLCGCRQPVPEPDNPVGVRDGRYVVLDAPTGKIGMHAWYARLLSRWLAEAAARCTGHATGLEWGGELMKYLTGEDDSTGHGGEW